MDTFQERMRMTGCKNAWITKWRFCKIYRQTKENLWKKDSQISQLHKKDAMDCHKSTKDIV